MVKRVAWQVAVFVLVTLLSAAAGSALLLDDDKILLAGFDDRVSQLELQSRKVIVVDVVASTATPFEDGTALLQQRQADIVVLYQYQDNKLAIIQPVDAWLQDKDVHAVLDQLQQEKKDAVAAEQKNQFLLHVLDGLGPLLIMAKDTRSYCRTVKDGYCDPKCDGTDLDCQCGDATCQYHETAATCIEDCAREGSSQGLLCTVLRDGVCNENCAQDVDCGLKSIISTARQLHDKNKVEYSTMIGVLFVLFLAVAAVLGYLLHLQQRDKKEQEKEGQEKKWRGGNG